MAIKIEVQKGPIELNMPTYRTKKRAELNREDAEKAKMIVDGQKMVLHTC